MFRCDTIEGMGAWKNTNAIYQIYPRSFQDSNGDGIGDLRGITSRLKYIKGDADSLGVDAIWISPIFLSPMADFGYDVSNFEAVDPLFGTIDDFDRLMEEAMRRDIKVMLDFVPNHTSSEHVWFKKALSSRDNKYREYYHFKDPAPGGGPPNNWLSVFGGSAWELDEASGQYYLHSFLKEQPNLNWNNQAVREKMGEALRFWLDRGVTGFRFDAVRWMASDDQYRDDPVNPTFRPEDDPYSALIHTYSRYGERLDEYLRALTDVIDEYEDALIVFEDYTDPLLPVDAQIKRLYGIQPSSAPMNLELTQLELIPRSFAMSVARYQKGKGDDADMVMCLGNHDNSRIVSRYGEDNAKLLAVLQLAIPGLPIVYYGEEIGMRDQLVPVDQLQDPFEKRVPGKGLGRDPQRTPMRWDSSVNAGFSTASSTWLPLGEDIEKINVAVQLKSNDSFLALYRRLFDLRKRESAFRAGKYEALLVSDDLYVFDVFDSSNRFCVILNFSEEEQDVLLNKACEKVLSVQAEDATRLDENSVTVAAKNGAIIRYL